MWEKTKTEQVQKVKKQDLDALNHLGLKGSLIISQHVVGSNIQDFEYTPKPNYPGPFKIFNEMDEEGLIR